MNEIETVLSRNDFTFEEAVEYFRKKIPVDTKRFYAIADKYKTTAFTIAGYTKIQIIKKFHEELLKAIEEGETAKTFRDNMNDFLAVQGYEGLSKFQADNIFRTNTQTAYQVGAYKQMTEPTVLRLRPYWEYDAVNDSRTRPSHLELDGKVFPADSPFWDIWYPPNGYRCRCTVRTLSKRQVEQRGLKVETEVPKLVEMRNGQVVNVMPDRGFATNPAKVGYEPDLKNYPEALKKVYDSKVKK